MKRLPVFLFLVVLMAALSACGDDAADSSPLAGSSWELVHYGFGEVVDPEAMVTATFEDGRVSGSTGCNEYSGSYELGDGIITFGDMAVTERACLDEAVMAQERAYLDALQSVGHYVLEADTLTMNYASGVLVFQNPNDVAAVMAELP